MNRILIPALAFIISFANKATALTRYWVGTTGNYGVAANWNTLPDGSGTPGVPFNTDDIVIDRNATITIDAAYSPSSLWIVNNAVVNFTTSGIAKTYTIGGGVVSPAFKINAGCTLNILGTSAITIVMFSGTAEIFGTLDFSGSGAKMDYFSGGVTRIKNGGVIRYGGLSSNGTGTVATLFAEAGSTYEIYKNAGLFPTGTYDPNSLLLNSGAIDIPAALTMGTSTGSYGNYEFNSPGYSGTTIGINNNCTVHDFSISNTGTGIWTLSTNGSTTYYTMTVNGNLHTAPGTILSINNFAANTLGAKLLIKGNFINNGLITETNNNTWSLIELGGSSSSTFSTVENGITNDVSLKINKSSNASVMALSDITLPNSISAFLTISNGNLDMLTNNKTLFVQNPIHAAVLGGYASSHIIGKLKRRSNEASCCYDFPVSNNATQMAKVSIWTSSTDETEWTVDFLPVNPNAFNGLTPGSIDKVTNYAWNITRSGVTPSDADFLFVYYDGLTQPLLELPAQAKVVQWNGSLWNSLGGSNTLGYIKSTLGSTGATAPGDPITSFGNFALGGVIGVIPINIEYLKGGKSNNNHILSWKVNCTSSRNITLELERSGDGRKFNNIYSITADYVRCLEPFERIDNDPLPGINYYRLKVTDMDGKTSYSNTIAILNKKTGLEVLSLSPNPVTADNNIILNIASAQDDKVEIVVSDVNGKIVFLQHNVAIIPGSNQLPIELPNLAAGNYHLTVITSKKNKTTLQFVKK